MVTLISEPKNLDVLEWRSCLRMSGSLLFMLIESRQSCACKQNTHSGGYRNWAVSAPSAADFYGQARRLL